MQVDSGIRMSMHGKLLKGFFTLHSHSFCLYNLFIKYYFKLFKGFKISLNVRLKNLISLLLHFLF